MIPSRFGDVGYGPFVGVEIFFRIGNENTDIEVFAVRQVDNADVVDGGVDSGGWRLLPE
ncbi:MAG: hypothetical protein IPM21_12125 [Acidobacteria bacterium]|nr:hypothetical protein [Acidobacteriota bacterium]